MNRLFLITGHGMRSNPDIFWHFQLYLLSYLLLFLKEFHPYFLETILCQVVFESSFFYKLHMYRYCRFLILCEYLIPQFCIKWRDSKGRKYQIFVKISCGFRTVQNNKSKILKFARDVSHDFIWILYGFIVYNLESTAHFSLYIHQRLKWSSH